MGFTSGYARTKIGWYFENGKESYPTHNKPMRGLTCGLLTLALTAGLAGNALALTGSQPIQADYADIKVSLDGTLLSLTDANGKAVEPFAVDVTVSPIDVVTRAVEVYESGTYAPLNDFSAKYDGEALANMTDAEYAAYSIEYANMIIDLVQAQMDNVGYLADQTVTLTVSKDANGSFGADDEGWQGIDTIIIDYPA